MLYLFTLLLVIVQGTHALMVTVPPEDVAVELGHNVMLSCMVINLGASESVQWKYQGNGSDTFNALSFNQKVLANTNKYVMTGTYNLTILNVTYPDSGTYRCSAAGRDYDAVLIVADLPDSVIISWTGKPIVGSLVNLRCTATNGRPIPFLRWVLNGEDVTHRAVLKNRLLTTAGYGDSTSNLPLTVTSAMRGNLATCFVAYKGWTDAMNVTYSLAINGSAILRMSSILVIVMAAFGSAIM